jgi:hypothetical protein
VASSLAATMMMSSLQDSRRAAGSASMASSRGDADDWNEDAPLKRHTTVVYVVARPRVIKILPERTSSTIW